MWITIRGRGLLSYWHLGPTVRAASQLHWYSGAPLLMLWRCWAEESFCTKLFSSQQSLFDVLNNEMYVRLIAFISRSCLLLLTIALLRCKMFEALSVLNGGMITLYTQALKARHFQILQLWSKWLCTVIWPWERNQSLECWHEWTAVLRH